MSAFLGRYAGMREFLLIWLGQLISGIGTRFSTFALGIWVLRSTESVLDFSLIFVAMSVPALLLLPFAGALVDRWDRRRTMVACEIGSALTVLALAVLTAMEMLALWHIYVGVGLTAIFNAFLQPAYAASLPLLVPREKLTQVNGLVQAGGAIGLLGGPLLAGILYGVIGISGILFVDAATFAAGAVLIALAKVPNPPREATPTRPNLLAEAAQGWRYVADRKGLFGLLGVFGTTNFFFGVASVAITPLVLILVDGDPKMLSYQMVVGGLGLLLGGALVSAWGGPRRKVDGVLGFTIIGGVLMALHGVYPSIVLVMACGFALFSTIPVIHSTNATLWQTKVPLQLQGRCFAILRIMTDAAMPVGYVLAGPLAQYVFEPAMLPGGALADSIGAVIGTGKGRGLGLMFVLLGVGMVVVAGAGYAVRAIRRIDEDLPDALQDTPAAAAPAT